MLTDLERDLLAFEHKRWTVSGAKTQAIWDTFDGMSRTSYDQVLQTLLDNPAALEHDPALINRLRRLRDSRRADRSARNLRPPAPPATTRSESIRMAASTPDFPPSATSAPILLEQRLLEQVKIAAHVALSPSMAQRIQVHVDEDWPAERLVASISAYVQADHLANDLYHADVERPASWREHRRDARLTSRWPWLRWWARRRPVRMQHGQAEVAVDRYLTYPQSTIVLARLGPPIVLEQVHGPAVRWS